MSNASQTLIRLNAAKVATTAQQSNWLWRRIVSEAEGCLTLAELRAEYERRLALVARAA